MGAKQPINGSIFLILEHITESECRAICLRSGGGNRKGDWGEDYALDCMSQLPKGTKVILEN